MILNGAGGANTHITGQYFELKTDLKTNLKKAGIDIEKVTFCQKRDFTKLMKKYGINMKEQFGKEYWPDEAFIYHNHLYVIEKKNQETQGSVDEKIQTGPYKKLIFDTCAKLCKLDGATYIYLLSNSFNCDKYNRHQIPYLKQNEIPVYFDNFPIQDYFN